MRIAISGTANTGKTTLIKNMLYVWPNYTTPEKTYRDILKEREMSHSSKTTPETQTAVLEFMVESLMSNDKKDKIIYDRCPVDNLAYTLWAYERNIEGFTNEFVTNTINIARESLRKLDIIFLVGFDDTFVVEDDGLRDTDVEYIKEIDNIFASLYMQYDQHPTANIFYPANDSPCIINLPSDPQARINLISEYIDPDGNLYGEESSILNPQKLAAAEGLLEMQERIAEEDRKQKELYNKFKI
jgi:predicted ATPase